MIWIAYAISIPAAAYVILVLLWLAPQLFDKNTSDLPVIGTLDWACAIVDRAGDAWYLGNVLTVILLYGTGVAIVALGAERVGIAIAACAYVLVFFEWTVDHVDLWRERHRHR